MSSTIQHDDDSGYSPEGCGYGYGSGDGYGTGSGSGFGSGSHIIHIEKTEAWLAWHYVRPGNHPGELVLRNGRLTHIGDHLHEDKIDICSRGLHASLSRSDAAVNRPLDCTVLTRVLVWGDIACVHSELVATDREIVEIVAT